MPQRTALTGGPRSVPPDATEIAAQIRRQDISALEAVDAAIARAEAMQPKLNFLVTPMFERARTRAKRDSLTGPFAGVPYLVKDMYDIEGVPTRWGTRLTQVMPTPTASCSQVKALEAAGLVIIGKTSLGEFGLLPTTEPLAFGPTRNPWDLDRSPGGSSGGSAAAVASGVVPMADAADGGGSIRIPASACGLLGLKPSRGRLIGEQMSAAGIELTAQHCVSRSVRDSAALFAAMERTGGDAVLPSIGAVTGPHQRRLRVGYLLEGLGGHQPDAETEAGTQITASLLEELGHAVTPTRWPFDGSRLVADFIALFAAAALSIKTMAGPAAAAGLEPFTLAMADQAARRPAAEFVEIVARLKEYEAAYDAWFDHHDVILSPVLLQPPVATGHIAGDVDDEILRSRILAYVGYTLAHNIAGAPAMSVPLHWTADGLPVGMHFAARRGGEQVLFALAYELESARPWAHSRAGVFATDMP